DLAGTHWGLPPLTKGANRQMTLSQVAWNLTSNPPGPVDVTFRLRPGMTLKIGTDPTKAESVKIQDGDYVSKQVTVPVANNYPTGTVLVPVLPPALPPVPPPVPTVSITVGADAHVTSATGGDAAGPTALGVIPTTPGQVPGSILGNPCPQDTFDPRHNTLLV